MKKQEVFYNVHAILRDIHHISEIEDITALPSSKSENGGEISIKYDRGKSTMVLASAQRDVMLAVSNSTEACSISDLVFIASSS